MFGAGVADRGPVPASSLIDVLAVDDRPDNLLALEAILGEVRANVVTASSGEEALRLLLKREFALVLLDVQMPGMDGYETAALIRGYAATRFLPIIFLTAYHRSEANVVRGYELGAVDYLFKPVHPDQLKGKVRVFLDLYRLRREAEVQAEKLREAERTEHERHVEELREHYELSLMREQVERERNLKEAMSLKAAQLEVLVAETEAARRELRRSNERLEVLADTANQLLLGSEPRALVDLLSRKLATHLGFEVYVKHAVEDCGSGLRLAAESGLTDAEVAALRRLEPGESFAGKVALERGSLVVRPADAGRGWEKGVLACFPLLAQGHLLGTLAFGTRDRKSVV